MKVENSKNLSFQYNEYYKICWKLKENNPFDYKTVAKAWTATIWIEIKNSKTWDGVQNHNFSINMINLGFLMTKHYICFILIKTHVDT